MAFCKVCICGKKIVFERRSSFPDNCPSCGRRIIDFLIYAEDDPCVEQLMKNFVKTESTENTTKDVSIISLPHKKKYVLRLSTGKEIEIPDEGCIIGRTETGAEELADFPSVSRQHLRVTPRRNIGILIEDISTYGTLVDGQRIVKYSPVRVAEGSKITLCDIEAVLTVKEEND